MEIRDLRPGQFLEPDKNGVRWGLDRHCRPVRVHTGIDGNPVKNTQVSIKSPIKGDFDGVWVSNGLEETPPLQVEDRQINWRQGNHFIRTHVRTK